VNKKRIVVNDLMQSGYAYTLSEPCGKNFHPDFRPDLTPEEMLNFGFFVGRYITDCQNEFPAAWFRNANLCPDKADPNVNCFGASASQPLSVWREKGWIWEKDPRGWFQWYCRYYSGRRCEDDERQIKRWRAMSRHVAQVKKNCEKYEFDCRPKQRQALLQWAYDSRDI